MFKSIDSGNNWTNTGLNEVNAISIDPGNHDVVYAGTANGVYASTDGGTSWDVMNDGLEDLNINSLGIFPGTYLFCGADVGGMYRWDIYTGMEELAGYHTTNVLRATPNPMRNNTSIAYYLSEDNQVRLSIYDVQGRLIDELVNTQLAAGAYQQNWNCTDTYGLPVAAGVYFCRLTVGAATNFLKFVVTR
ncbi:MAG: T9SS type A sorting domain-containing protein [candidate division WOR-3 bacterium]|nr:MAG: T9SS type A sorting domain-containing protein [candidate division WOR-3 bacterium]